MANEAIRMIAENLPEAVIVLDRNGDVFFGNEHARTLLKYKGSELAGKKFSEITSKRCASSLLKIFDVGKAGQVLHFSCLFDIGEAEIVGVELSSVLIKPAGSEDVFLLSLVHDITERMKIGEALERRSNFENLITKVAAGFISIQTDDIEDGFRNAMRDIATFAGADRCCWFQVDHEAKTLSCMVEWLSPKIEGPRERPQNVPIAAMPEWYSRLEAGETVAYTDLSNSSRKDHLWVEMISKIGIKSIITVPVIRDKSLTGYLAMATFVDHKLWKDTDVTSLKIVAEIFASLAQRQEMESEITVMQERLAQAQKMEAIGTLASGIAHDFNNLLHTISGFNELASQRCGKDDETAYYFERIEETVRRGAALVKNLLTFSREKSEKLSPINLNNEITKILEIIEKTLPANVRVKTRLAKSLWPVKSHKGLLEQVLLNLATNSRDAIGDNDGEFIIETLNHPLDREFVKPHGGLRAGDYVRIRVSDNGCGMENSVCEHIFEPFYTTKPVDKGTGLGLSTIYGIVKNHKGLITCESEPDSGATFDIYLPALRFGKEAADKSLPYDPAPKTEGGETLLIIEDEEHTREIYSKILQALGYRVLLAKNTEEALLTFNERKDEIDGVLLDLGIPKLGGTKCYEELRKIRDDIRVLIVSGYSMHERGKRVMEMGADGFLQKPCGLKELAGAIKQVLEK